VGGGWRLKQGTDELAADNRLQVHPFTEIFIDRLVAGQHDQRTHLFTRHVEDRFRQLHQRLPL
jgi:hypothetical protein